MQIKLHRWAGEDEGRRFGDLYNLVCDPAFLLVAWRRVKGNRGARSAGVDGITVRHIEQGQGVDSFLAELRSELRARTYRPSLVRERMIPKADGKFRRLGIATVRDRVVQAALKLVLEPIFEADFQPFSYGFRPRRGAQDAIAEIRMHSIHSYEWVLEADIKACFDEISHSALVDRVNRRITDKRVLALVKAFLKAGILTQLGQEEDTITGTPQGGILSPLLANIALSALDDHFAQEWQTLMGTENERRKRRRHGLGNWRIIRYADDFVVMVSGTREHAEALRDTVQAVLAPIGLRLSEAKTRVVHLDEGFDFLGFRIQRRHKRGTDERVVYTYPSKRSFERIKEKVRALTHGSHLTLQKLLPLLNAVVRGWCNYFRHGVSKQVFSALGVFVWRRVAHWIRKKHGGLSWKTLFKRYMPDGHIAADGVRLFEARSVPVTRYQFRGHRIPTPWTEQTLTN
ncbi:MAG: group II intron reverse transcriptase/maturase [Chloroflexi bacterium]|nr:MAG: group II intron reverse transcriptase/maturase [Chloroflexota bacterium]